MHAAVLLLVAAASRSPARPPHAPEGPLLHAVRVVMDYLDAVRMAEPYPGPGRPAEDRLREDGYGAALRLVDAATRAEIEARGMGDPHPLAPWWAARRGRVLQDFRVLRVRHAPGGAAVATVLERFRTAGPRDEALDEQVAEYLAAPTGPGWRVLDRRPRGGFTDGEIEARLAGPRERRAPAPAVDVTAARVAAP